VYTSQELYQEDYDVVVSLKAEDTALPSHTYDGLFSFTTGSATIDLTSEVLLASEGGTVEDPSGVLVTLPPGVLTDSLMIVVGAVTNPPPLPDTLLAVGTTFFYGPEGLIFCPLPGVGRLLYTDDDLSTAGVADPLTLMVFSFNSESGNWEERQILSNDTNNRIILFQICRFGYVTLAVTQKTSVRDERTLDRVPPDDYFISCHPNPFNASLFISFDIPDVPSPVEVTLRVYNVLGAEIRTLLQQQLPGGRYTTVWDGSDGQRREVPSGVYFCRMSVKHSQDSGGFIRTHKVLFLK
jgi:hypothetical protein